MSIAIDHAHIKGWGLDADPENDPTYPMKQRTNAEHDGLSWERPGQQPLEEEVLISIERPNITAVYGTSTPPAGLSGMIRRSAYKQSESSYGRWLPLLLADRVDVVEGLIDDLLHGNFLTFFTEKGYKARWKYDRQGLLVSIATTVIITTGVLMFLFRKRRSS